MGFKPSDFARSSCASVTAAPPRPTAGKRKPTLPPGGVVVTVPGMRLVNPLNAWEHWRVRSKRQAREKATVRMLLPAIDSLTVVGPLSVTLTRRYSRQSKAMDSDAVPGAFKSVRDQVAAWLGRDDGPKAGIDWRYADERAADFAVVIDVKYGYPPLPRPRLRPSRRPEPDPNRGRDVSDEISKAIDVVNQSRLTDADKAKVSEFIRLTAMSSADMTSAQLVEARRLAGLTAWQAARVTGIRRSRIFALEVDCGTPDATEVALLDEAYGLGDRPMPLTS